MNIKTSKKLIEVALPLLSVLLLLCFGAEVSAKPEFPKLSGPVVDTAEMISAGTEQRITEKSLEHQRATTNQVVVVTVGTLQGEAIESFGYQLGREWGIGQKDKNNGVLLIIAKSEREFRIEVGYGLEGELTDAISANIIHAVIRPYFKLGDFDGGIEAGVDAIVQALGGQYQLRENKSAQGERPGGFWLIFVLIIVMMFFSNGRSRRAGLAGAILGAGGFGGGRLGGGRSGGFGGGGGGFGGGGASGGW